MSRTSRIVSIAVALALLAALLAWWLRRPSNDAVVDTGARAPAPAAPMALRTAPPANEPTAARPAIELAPATASADPGADTGVFAGSVVDTGTGRGVPGAEITFARGDDAISITADAGGRFEFRPPALDRYKLAVASAEGYLPFAPAWNESPIELVARASIRVEGIVVHLAPAVEYSGVVLDPDGEPVVGATIELLGARSGSRTLLPIEAEFRSGQLGSFRFHAPDFATLEARHPCCDVGRAVLDGAAQVSHRLEIRLGQGPPRPDHGPAQPHGDARIRGKVVAGTDAVPAFTVAVIAPDGMRTQVARIASFLDGDGTFAVDGLAPGDYVVQVMAFGYARPDPVDATASDDPTPITVSLPGGGTLTGTVVDAATGAPLELAKVSVEGNLGAGDNPVPLTATAVTDAEGRFVLRGLPIGRTSVFVTAFAHDTRIVSGLMVTDGAELGPIEIALSPVAEGETPKLELAGIGAALGAADDGLAVQNVFDGGGAAEAGIVTGDVILAVNGKNVTELGFGGAIQEIRGVEGSSVTLTVRRAGGAVEDLVATRRKIRA